MSRPDDPVARAIARFANAPPRPAPDEPEHEPPVLFLRAFFDDVRQGVATRPDVEAALAGLGPLVTIGGERLPPRELWKPAVERLLGVACAVVVDADSGTGGVIWELGRVRELVPAERVL